MSKKMDLSDLETVKDNLFEFIWTFKIGDNIMYNFEILKELYKAKENSNSLAFNKPITVTIVSIIEAILIDFITRISQASNHRPSNIDTEKLEKMKCEIKKERVKNGDRYKRKLYGFKEIIKLSRKYELFGGKNDNIYNQLKKFSDMRNRVHIENYYKHFEVDEFNVFTSKRLIELEYILYNLWNVMVSDYKRPWKRST